MKKGSPIRQGIGTKLYRFLVSDNRCYNVKTKSNSGDQGRGKRAGGIAGHMRKRRYR